MKFRTGVIVTFFLAFVFSGCSRRPTSLVGTYAVEENGKLTEFILIKREGDKFTLSEKQSGRWLTPVEINPVSQVDLEKILKEPVTVSFTALGNNSVAIVQVPKGWKSGRFECKTGIWLATMLGPIDLHKQ